RHPEVAAGVPAPLLCQPVQARLRAGWPEGRLRRLAVATRRLAHACRRLARRVAGRGGDDPGERLSTTPSDDASRVTRRVAPPAGSGSRRCRAPACCTHSWRATPCHPVERPSHAVRERGTRGPAEQYFRLLHIADPPAACGPV